MEDTLKTAPFFSPEAQEIFLAGSRVFDATRPAHEIHLAAEGVFLGYERTTPGGGEMAIVEWDEHPSNGQPHAVRRESFSGIRNLYR